MDDVLDRFMQDTESEDAVKDKLKELQEHLEQDQMHDDHGSTIIGSRDYPLN
ncbi:MAG: hypothetical protein SP1CHLAM54_06880 [Chlamydiia bacterium]|nr:hypothetical protein [Chlamydiia bacterium]MCH9615594.1 hypothetical protein [Chlamydiia bacterium]MCH9629003.1 hypothetical protein [Chlamydiia bacterium]